MIKRKILEWFLEIFVEIFISPTSPTGGAVSRPHHTGAGKYVRHQAAKEDKGLGIKDQGQRIKDTLVSSMPFRDESDFISPTSPIGGAVGSVIPVYPDKSGTSREPHHTGAGRYARHQAAKETMKKTKQILWVTVYKTILLHSFPNIIVEAIGRTKVERRSSEGVVKFRQ